MNHLDSAVAQINEFMKKLEASMSSEMFNAYMQIDEATRKEMAIKAFVEAHKSVAQNI
jgi:hypothetical protein